MRRLVLCLAVATALAGCKTDLFTGLTEREANEMVSVLRLADVDADRRVSQNGAVAVRVPDAQFAAAVEILKAEGYPRQQYSSLGDVFQGNGFVSSQTEERARFVFAMSEELSRTITEIDGILSARVHVVLPVADPLSRSSTPSSASVVIRHAEARDAESLLPQIKAMVANSIEGLDYGNVSVVFIPVPARDAPVDVPPATAAPAWLPTGMDPMMPLYVGAGLAIFGIAAVGGALLGRGPKRRADELRVESAPQ